MCSVFIFKSKITVSKCFTKENCFWTEVRRYCQGGLHRETTDKSNSPFNFIALFSLNRQVLKLLNVSKSNGVHNSFADISNISNYRIEYKLERNSCYCHSKYYWWWKEKVVVFYVKTTFLDTLLLGDNTEHFIQFFSFIVFIKTREIRRRSRGVPWHLRQLSRE